MPKTPRRPQRLDPQISSLGHCGSWVKPLQNVSLYGNYIEGLQPGTIVGPTYANAGEVLPPFVTEQWEAGVKVDWGRLTTTLSLFEITQPSGSAPSPTGTFSA
ncbi:TonB-dependent receptor domain-containing protein, partial [Ramlibacter sp.]|uniref:TonB-dependent receptor domain-containing protein n=1 Tax=Ramlibacter sp. TaxID=1917967 RepID=UPI002D6BE56D